MNEKQNITKKKNNRTDENKLTFVVSIGNVPEKKTKINERERERTWEWVDKHLVNKPRPIHKQTANTHILRLCNFAYSNWSNLCVYVEKKKKKVEAKLNF